MTRIFFQQQAKQPDSKIKNQQFQKPKSERFRSPRSNKEPPALDQKRKISSSECNKDKQRGCNRLRHIDGLSSQHLNDGLSTQSHQTTR